MRSLLLKTGGCALLAAAALFLTAGPAAASSSPIVGHVYVNDNTASANTVAGFDRHANGTLTPHPGSPFAAGGAGTGTGLASQGAIQVASDGRFVLAVDAGSNQISVLRIEHGGGLAMKDVRLFRRDRARQHRRAPRAGLCGECRRRRLELHRVQAHPARTVATDCELDVRTTGQRAAW